LQYLTSIEDHPCREPIRLDSRIDGGSLQDRWISPSLSLRPDVPRLLLEGAKIFAPGCRCCQARPSRESLQRPESKSSAQPVWSFIIHKRVGIPLGVAMTVFSRSQQESEKTARPGKIVSADSWHLPCTGRGGFAI